MRSEQDIHNLRDQYLEQIAFIKDSQNKFSDFIEMNKGIISTFEVPYIKTLEAEVRRLNWVLGEETYYPGPHYRTGPSKLTFEDFTRGKWISYYTRSYHKCLVHGTFEIDDTCIQCAFEYRDTVSRDVQVSPAKESEDVYAT